jgi:cell fate (sporulation/competence/biofilm development) regulator YlbF (YheA/YmcA/DUF963 family)
MDRVIDCARQLGKAMQADERYIRFMAAQQQNDEDEALQALIANFTAKRDELGAETHKEDRDGARISELTSQVKDMYAQIFANENMRSYSSASEDFQKMMTFVTQIISGSQSGLDPDAIEFQTSGCGGGGGGCSSGCGGCK